MRTKDEVDGIAVIALDSGAKLGEVEELLFDLEENQLIGILLEDAGLTHPAKAIPCSSVRSIGPDAVMVDNEGSIVDADSHDRMRHLLKQERKIKGKQVFTVDGENLGKIVDIHFDEKTGKIEGYEVSGGIFADAYTGRSLIPAPKTIKIGKDVTIVPTEVARMMEEQVGGIKGAARRVSEKTQAAREELASSARERMTGRNIDELVGEARGKRAYHDVVTDEGTIIIVGGQLIEDRDIDAARRNHKERELLETAGIDTWERLRVSAGQGWDEGKKRVHEGAQTARTRATGLFEQARERFMGWKEQASDKIEEQRIQKALGRPVTRVILDLNDQVILNTGDIITHRAIEEARRANILEGLLGSVHVDDNPTKEELKAPAEGRAALKKQ